MIKSKCLLENYVHVIYKFECHYATLFDLKLIQYNAIMDNVNRQNRYR